MLVDFANNAGLHNEVAEVLSDVTSATINVSEKMYVISNDEMDYNNDDGSFGRSKIYRSDAESSLVKFSDIKIKSDSLSAYNNVLELLNDKEVQSVIEGFLLMKSSIDISTTRVKEIIKF